MQLLQDTFIIENLQVLSEGKTDGKMRVKGVFGRCNEKNNNGRIYPTAVLEAQLGAVSNLISERRLCGELDHPQNDTVKLSNASHLITKLDMKGDELIGEAELLNTPAGLTAQALIRGGVKIGISSRGMGTLSENEVGDKIVNEDFRLVTFDLVADPSTRGAFPGLSESTESKFVNQSQAKLKKEANLVTMLRSKIREAYSPVTEAYERKARLDATRNERNKRAGLHRERTGQHPKSESRLDASGGGSQAGERKELHKFKKDTNESIVNTGIWHRIADYILEALDEDISSEIDKAETRRKEAGPIPARRGTGFLDRRHAEKYEIARAKGMAKGSVKGAQIMQKAKDKGAAAKAANDRVKAFDARAKAKAKAPSASELKASARGSMHQSARDTDAEKIKAARTKGTQPKNLLKRNVQSMKDKRARSFGESLTAYKTLGRLLANSLHLEGADAAMKGKRQKTAGEEVKMHSYNKRVDRKTSQERNEIDKAKKIIRKKFNPLA